MVSFSYRIPITFEEIGENEIKFIFEQNENTSSKIFTAQAIP
jgi:hypothetical protein